MFDTGFKQVKINMYYNKCYWKINLSNKKRNFIKKTRKQYNNSKIKL